MKSNLAVITVVALILMLFVSAHVHAQDAGSSSDHPFVRRIQGFDIQGYEVRKTGQHRFRTDDGYTIRRGVKNVIEYHLREDFATRVASDILQNHVRSITEQGGTVLFHGTDRITMTLQREGNHIWIEVIVKRDSYIVTVVEQEDSRVTHGVGHPTVVLHKHATPARTITPHGKIGIAPSTMLRPPLITYYVLASAGESGNGTDENPFGTIGQALAAADAHQAHKVRIILGGGTYQECFTLSRATEIIGMEDQPVIRGSITNTNRMLMLKQIDLSHAPGKTLHQVGGELQMEHCNILHTSLIDGDPESGRGVVLTGGAHATLRNVSFFANDGQALLMSGEGTKVTASDINASGNRVNPLARDNALETKISTGTGTIEVSYGALLLLEDFTVDNNDFNGILVHEMGLAHLRNGEISNTLNPSGNNLAIFRGGKVEVHHFITRNAGSCGIRMIGSYLKVVDIEFRGNPIAMVYHVPPESRYDFMACLYALPNNVLMENNGINFDSVDLTIPDITDYIDEESEDTAEGPYCPGVPWE
jgi:hypothetical protein